MEDLVIVFGNNHLWNKAEHNEIIKRTHQLYMLKGRHVQVDSNQEEIRGKVLESNISNDDNEELSDGEETEN